MTRTGVETDSVGIRAADEPKDRPICEYKLGALWIDDGGYYKQQTPEHVRVLLWSLSHYPNSHTQRINEINTALEAHKREKHEEQ